MNIRRYITPAAVQAVKTKDITALFVLTLENLKDVKASSFKSIWKISILCCRRKK